MSRLQQLAERRAVLVERLAFLRAELGNEFRQLEHSSGYMEKGYTLAQRVRAHPKLVAASGLAAMFLARRYFPGGIFAGTAFTAAKAGFSFLKNRFFSHKPTATD